MKKKTVKKTVKKTRRPSSKLSQIENRVMGPNGNWGTTESDIMGNLNEDLKEAWKKIRAFASGLGEQRIYSSARAVMFSRKICYFYVRPQKSFLEVWIFLPYKIEGLKASQAATTKEKYSNMFKLVHADQVEEPLTDWIQEAFKFAT